MDDDAALRQLADVHCHVADELDDEVLSTLMRVKTGHLCIMSSTLDNQERVKQASASRSDGAPQIVPCFGLHPWFIHEVADDRDGRAVPSKEDHYKQLFSEALAKKPEADLEDLLPHLREPVPLSELLQDLRDNLVNAGPYSMLGEIGLDKAFRVPLPDVVSKKYASPFATPLSHQILLAEAQLAVACELRRNVSFHSVRAPMDTLDLLNRMRERQRGWDDIYVCLHSFGGKAEMIQQIQNVHKGNVFFSFATVISGRSPKFHDMLRAVREDRLLIESDVHRPEMVDGQMIEVLNEVQAAREWSREHAVKMLKRNFETFRAGPSRITRQSSLYEKGE